MTKYDVTDETLIDASPDTVYRAIVDEMNGKTAWGANPNEPAEGRYLIW